MTLFSNIGSLLGAIILFLLITNNSFSQQVEYRITDDGKYQYLSNRKEAGMVFDESLGTYYKEITVRTFFLETQRKGYLPDSITFSGFVQLTLREQQALLKQPYNERDCSSNNVSAECLEFTTTPAPIPKAQNATVIDLSPKCNEPNQSPRSSMSLTSQLVVTPGDSTIVNNACGDQQQPKSYSSADTTQQKQQRVKSVKQILGKD